MMNSNEPLAFRMKPECLEDYVGQEHILAKDKILYRTIKADRLSSIYYGALLDAEKHLWQRLLVIQQNINLKR